MSILQQLQEDSVRDKVRAATEGLIEEKREEADIWRVGMKLVENEDGVEIVPRLTVTMEVEGDISKLGGEGLGNLNEQLVAGHSV